VFARHERLRDIVREGARRAGFRPFAPDAIASRTVTALFPPEGIEAKQLVAAMRKRGITIASGQGAYTREIIRIGHMGFAREEDMREVLRGLDQALDLYPYPASA
jgi:aspartate aminotransferase-like enzyme